MSTSIGTPFGSLDLGIWPRARVRLVRQTEVSECGLACLAMVLSFYGHRIDLPTLRRKHPPSVQGTSLRRLMAIADDLNLTPRAVKVPLPQLGKLSLPAVLHWDLNHFVVLEKVRGGAAQIHDPDGSSRWISFEELSDTFTGVAVELHPNYDFTPRIHEERARWSDLWGRLVGLRRTLTQVLVLSFVLQAYVLALPYYSQVAIDTAAQSQDRELLAVLALGFGLFTLVNAGALLLRSFVLLSAGSTLGFGIASNLGRKLFRLPVDWYHKRHSGDIISRFQSIEPIQRALTQGMTMAFVDGLLALTTLTLMFIYSPALASIAVVTFLTYLTTRALTFRAQRDAEEAQIVASAKEHTVLLETLRGMVTLRLYNREVLRHSLWQSRVVDWTNANIRVARIQAWQRAAETMLFGIENIVTIWLAISMMIEGDFTIGMTFAYMAYKIQFVEKAKLLVEQGVDFRMLRLHLERLSDITSADEDVSFGPSASRQSQLTGKIELRGVSYRYGPTEKRVLNDINLVISEGEHVAITGRSGGGKSTLLKVMVGLVEPEAGIILIDGLELGKFGHKSFHDQIAVVLQDDALFSGSIAENIALFDSNGDIKRVQKVAQAAAIHADIMELPMQYESLVGDLGATLSGGQRQRLLLARALYRQPKMLFVDEGTSHLDAQSEARVNHAIAQMGITRIVIAHRAETIKAADRVIRLENGEIQNL